MIDVCITLDLDMDHHDIVEGEEVLGMGFIHPFPVVSVAFISEVPEDGGCKGRISLSRVKESGDVSDAAINGLRGWLQSEVEGKLVFLASGSYTVDNVSAIDATAVPGISSTVGRLDKDLVGAMIICIDGEYFVEKSLETFHTNGFVVAAGSDVQLEGQNTAEFFCFKLARQLLRVDMALSHK